MEYKSVNLILNKIKSTEQIKLNIGIGNSKFGDNFIGIDANDGKLTDVIFDITKLSKVIPVESIDEIYSRHTIEHLSRKKIHKIIGEWVSLLKPNGKITLNFPDLDRYVDFYTKHRDQIPIQEFSKWIYGNQKDKYDLHRTGLNGKLISETLESFNVKILSVLGATVYVKMPRKRRIIIGTEVIGVKNES